MTLNTRLTTTFVIHTKRGKPHSFGWLRRSGLDVRFGGEVWERPDGSFYIAQPGMEVEVVEEWVG